MIAEDIEKLIHNYTKIWHDIDELIPFSDNPTALISKIDVYKSVISDLEKLRGQDEVHS